MIKQAREHLVKKLIPFWKGLRDDVNGGYYGYMGSDLKVDPEAVKGCILNSRITWFFSSAATLLGDKSLLEEAAHAFAFMKDACLDREYGGMYWSVTCDGKPADTTKHTYNQAFTIYALAAYYEASGDPEALRMALDLYGIIETRCRDEGGCCMSLRRIQNSTASAAWTSSKRTSVRSWISSRRKCTIPPCAGRRCSLTMNTIP